MFNNQPLLRNTRSLLSCVVPTLGIKYSQPGNKTFPALFVDQSSVEIFTAEGTMSLTNLVFPSSIYNQLTVEGAMSECQVRKLNRVW